MTNEIQNDATVATETKTVRGSNPVGANGVLIRPIDLNVPYVQRAKAKAMGAWFNGKTKTWVAPAGKSYGAFKAAGFVGKAKAPAAAAA